MSKPREFWIFENNRGAYHYALDKKDPDQIHDFHVIEKSAYDELDVGLKASQKLARIYADKNERLEQQALKLAEALEYYASRESYDWGTDFEAKRALKEYRGEK